jgi:hypothetical protein
VDSDNDGNVDNVCFIARGANGAWSDLLWPHAWELYTQVVEINGKRLWNYNLQLEDHLRDSGASVLCHEMFHTLGAPDLYHYTSDDRHPMSTWDLMEYNITPPQHMSAYMKYRYGRWIASIPEIVASGTYSLYPLQVASNNCFKIRSPNSSTEYFVLEHRKTRGFDSKLPGTGLLIYRINTVKDGQGNSGGPPDEVYVYRPGGTCTLEGTPDTAFFSASVARTKFNDTSNPTDFLSTCSPAGISITQVGTPGITITFRVDIPAKPYTLGEAQEALLVAAGLKSTTPVRYVRLNVVADSGIDMADVALLLRKVNGVDANP